MTAAQAVASRVGAPLGHDYAVVSLSDRLKPWDVIARRVTAAVEFRQQGHSIMEATRLAGEQRLRRALASRLVEHGISASPEQIITTVGATHALDIVSRTLLRPGDPVMVEEPGWAVEFARLAALGMHILPVPRRADGPDLDVMARYCETYAPKLFVSVSVFHNPTGYCLSPGGAHRVLQLAQQRRWQQVQQR